MRNPPACCHWCGETEELVGDTGPSLPEGWSMPWFNAQSVMLCPVCTAKYEKWTRLTRERNHG